MYINIRNSVDFETQSSVFITTTFPDGDTAVGKVGVFINDIYVNGREKLGRVKKTAFVQINIRFPQKATIILMFNKTES